MNLFDLVGNISINAGEALGSLSSFESRLQNVGSKLTGAGAGMMALGASVAAPAAGLIKFGIDYNSTMQDLETSFKVMLGSQEKATNMTQKLIEMGAATPFEATQLAEYTKTMLSFGYTEANVIPIMSRLGDVSLGNDAKMSSLTRTMGQINALGKLQGGDLNQLIGQGWNPLNAIMKKTGETTAEVRKRMEAGKVTYKEVEQALIATTSKGGQFYHGMAEGAKTFSGQMSTLRDVVGQTMGQITKPLFDMAMQVLPKVIEKLGALQKWFGSLSTGSQRMAGMILLGTVAFGGLIMVVGALLMPLGMVISAIGTIGIPVTAAIVAIGPLIAIIGAIIIKTGAWKVALNLLKAAFNMVKLGIDVVMISIQRGQSPLQALSNAFATLGIRTAGPLSEAFRLLAAIMGDASDRFNTIRASAAKLWGPLKTLGSALLGLANSVKGFVIQAFILLMQIWRDIQPVVMNFINKIVSTVLPALLKMKTEIVKFVSVLLTILGKGLKQIQTAWTWLWPYLKAFIIPILNFIVDLLANIFKFIANLFKALRALLTGDWSGLWSAIKGMTIAAINLVLSLIRNLGYVALSIWKLLEAGLKAVNKAIWNFVLDVWNTIASGVMSIVRGIWNGIKTAWNGIVSVTMSVFRTVKSFIGDMMSGALNLVKNAWDSIKNAFSTGVNKAKSLVKDMISGIKSILGGLVSSMFKFGSNMIGGFVDGIKSKAGAVKDAAKSVVSGAKAMIGFSSPTEEGPGADSDKWGPNLVNMIAKGMLDSRDSVKNAAKSISEDLAFRGDLKVSTTALRGTGKLNASQGVTIVINNPHIFNQQDIDKMMNPVIRRLQQMGVKAY